MPSKKTEPPLGRSVALRSSMSENWSYIFPRCWTRCFFCQLGMWYNYGHDAAHHPTAASALPVNLPRLSTWKAPECRCLHGLHMKRKKGELGFCPTGLTTIWLLGVGGVWSFRAHKMFFETCWIEGCFFCDSMWHFLVLLLGWWTRVNQVCWLLLGGPGHKLWMDKIIMIPSVLLGYSPENVLWWWFKRNSRSPMPPKESCWNLDVRRGWRKN